MMNLRLGDKKKTSAPSWVFRIVLSAIGVFTVLESSHAVRYALCGVLLAILVGEWVYSWRRKRLDLAPAERGKDSREP
jgi:hypothetical protein